MPVIILKTGKVIEMTITQYEKLVQAILVSSDTTDVTFKIKGVSFLMSEIEDDIKKIDKLLKST